MPLISLVLSVKNGLPHLRDAMEALRRQTYRDFELIVQDGVSTDGSLEYLRSIQDLPRIEIASEPDSGIGQAYNRGISRARGDLLCMASCDEILDDDAIQKGVDWFSTFPNAAVVYGGVRLVTAAGRVFQVFLPPRYELAGVVNNQIVLPAAATFFNRARIGADMYYDEALKTCPDYDFWLRLGTRFGPEDFVAVPEPIVTSRADRTSQTFRAESFEMFCRDKLWILDRFLDGRGKDLPLGLRESGRSGILNWAAESVYEIEGASPAFMKWRAEAAQIDPQSPRFLRLANPDAQPDSPSCPAGQIPNALSLEALQTFPYWTGAEVHHGSPARVVTGEQPWAYAAQIPLSANLDENRWAWVKLDVRIVSGQIGISLFTGGDLRNERLILAGDDRIIIWIKMNDPAAKSLMFRNGSFPQRSVVEILAAAVESCPKPGAH